MIALLRISYMCSGWSSHPPFPRAPIAENIARSILLFFGYFCAQIECNRIGSGSCAPRRRKLRTHIRAFAPAALSARWHYRWVYKHAVRKGNLKFIRCFSLLLFFFFVKFRLKWSFSEGAVISLVRFSNFSVAKILYLVMYFSSNWKK